MNQQQALEIARSKFLTETNTYGCAETSFTVLKYAYGLPNPEDTSMAMALNGGIAGWGSICSAVTGAALAVGQLTSQHIADHNYAKRIARQIISRLLTEFRAENGSIACIDLIKLDIRKPENHARFIEAGIWRDICMRQIEFIVKRLYNLNEESVWEKIVSDLEDEGHITFFDHE
jgi:C_GCAxxG_C_C family probable redox protein